MFILLESHIHEFNFVAERHSKAKTFSKQNVELQLTINNFKLSTVSQIISFEKLKDVIHYYIFILVCQMQVYFRGIHRYLTIV